MNIRKTGEYIADVERQFEWYASNAGLNVAARYLAAVESVSQLTAINYILMSCRNSPKS